MATVHEGLIALSPDELLTELVKAQARVNELERDLADARYCIERQLRKLASTFSVDEAIDFAAIEREEESAP